MKRLALFAFLKKQELTVLALKLLALKWMCDYILKAPRPVTVGTHFNSSLKHLNIAEVDVFTCLKDHLCLGINRQTLVMRRPVEPLDCRLNKWLTLKRWKSQLCIERQQRHIHTHTPTHVPASGDVHSENFLQAVKRQLHPTRCLRHLCSDG